MFFSYGIENFLESTLINLEEILKKVQQTFKNKLKLIKGIFVSLIEVYVCIKYYKSSIK